LGIPHSLQASLEIYNKLYWIFHKKYAATYFLQHEPCTYSLWWKARHEWSFIGLDGVGAMLLLTFREWLFFTNGIRAMPFLGAFAPEAFKV
jgi:hypothetical protein